jgi:predicted site-specific integrase-resolvase
LALGREQSRIVRSYLEALEQHRPKRGRKRTPDSIKKQLADIKTELRDATAFERVHLLQQRKDLENELERHSASTNGESLAGLEKSFVKVVRAYSDSKGISYSTWREVGVPADVLSRAGVPRTRG